MEASERVAMQVIHGVGLKVILGVQVGIFIAVAMQVIHGVGLKAEPEVLILCCNASYSRCRVERTLQNRIYKLLKCMLLKM